MRNCLYTLAVLITLQLFLLLEPNITAGASTHLQSLFGAWKVTGVRLDETLSRKAAYNIDDPELLGRVVVISQQQITTTMPEGTCTFPEATREAATLDALVDKTMGKGKFGGTESDKFSLSVDTKKEVDVFWVTCREGHIGPDYPFGPNGHNWIARISRSSLAMRWYDNTILLLKRVK